MEKQIGIIGFQLGLCLALAAGLISPSLAQSITPSRRVNTNTTVTQEGDRIDINGGQLSRDEANLFHQFEQFGLSEDQIARFLSNPDIRNILATVDGGDVSIINGLLQVSGGDSNLYLLNPAGIIFGPNARLDLAGSFFANTANGLAFGDRTLDIFGTPDFANLVGDPTAFAFGSLNPGVVINAGNLAVPTGETLSLMGGTVINTGSLSASEGSITVAAIPGERYVRLSQEGALLSLDVLPNDLAALSTNPTRLPELLTGSSVPGVGLVTEPDGTVRLTATENPVIVPDVPGVAIASGTLDVSGAIGGSIDVVGDRVGLVAATLSANGITGGGNIRIGGDYQGNGALPNANRTYVNADSTLSANANTTGDGGRIIIWADGSTVYSGNLSATGGNLSGNGGFAEVSGRQNLGYDGTANLSAPNGTPGTLLLDPENIVITADGEDDAEINSDSEILVDDRPGETLSISQAALQTSSAALGNITLEASNNITIEALNGGVLQLANFVGTGDAPVITFRANADGINGGDFNMDDPLDTIQASGWGIEIYAEAINVGRINTRGGAAGLNIGDTVLEATGNIRTSSIDVYGDNPSSANSGNIRIISETGSINTTRGILSANSSAGTTGSIYLEAEGNIDTARLSSTPVTRDGVTSRGITVISRNGSINTSYASSLPDSLNNEDITGLFFGFDPNGSSAAQDVTASTPAGVVLRAPNGSITVHDVRVIANEGNQRFRLDSPNIIVSPAIDPDTEQPLNSERDISIDLSGNLSNIFFGGNLNGNIDLTLDAAQNSVEFSGSLGSEIPFRSIVITASDASIDGSIFTNNGNITLDTNVNLLVDNEPTIIDAGMGTFALTGSLEASENNLVIRVNDISLEAPNTSIAGRNNSQLEISPGAVAQRINIGTTDSDNSLHLTPAELLNIDGFSQVTIGRADGEGGIDITDAIRFNDAVVLEPGQGAVQLGANLTSTGTDISLGNTVLTNDVNLTSAGGSVQFLGTVDGSHDLTVQSGAGNILFADTVGSNTPLQDLTVGTTGIVTFGDDVTLAGSLDLGTASVLQLGGALQVGEDMAIAPPITLTDNAVITSGGSLTLESAVSSPEAAHSLALAANGGVLSTQAIATNGGILQLTGSDGITINGALNTTGQGTGGDITFASEVLGGQDLSVQSGAGNVVFADVVGSDTPLQNLIVGTTGSVTFGDDVTLTGSLDLGTARTLQLGGNLQTLSGNLVLQTPITLIDDVSVTAAAGNLRLTEDVQSPGGTNALNLTAGGSTLTAQNINTNGGDLTLQAPDVLTVGELTTANAAGSGDLTIIAGTRITTGNIDTSALTGDGGDVFIDPTDDIEVGFVNTQSRDAAGGDVTAITGSLLRSINTFVAADGTVASISAIGGTQGGNITISHFGGAERVPFLVGNAATNGTAGAIATGTLGNINGIFPDRIFPGSYDQFGTAGNVRLITQDFPIPEPDVYPTPTLEIREEIERLEIDTWVFELEEYFTRMSERYLGIEGTEISTLNEIRAMLQEIGRQTGERPAIIYAFFYPAELSQIEDAPPLEITWLGGDTEDTQIDIRGQDILHLVLVSAEGDPVLARVPGATRSEVPDLVNTFRQRILRGEGNPRDRTYVSVAQEVYGLLLKPLETPLQEREITNLVYVMEPGLRNTPLAAMMPDNNSFIIEDYSLGQMPSFSLTDTTYTGVRGTEVLAGGISDFSGFSTLSALPGAVMEVETIGLQLWPDELLIDEDMTRADLIRVYEEDPHGIVHIATHADFVDGDISESYIQLYGERLHLDEIRDMGWSNDPTVRLLVLSACNTATGSVEAELGFGGIAVQAGVQSVLASQWKVNDAGTLALMAAFYEQLGHSEVMTKAEALRRAQEALFNEGIWFQGGYLQGTEATIILSEEMADLDNLYPSHPYFWSGFTMLGSPW